MTDYHYKYLKYKKKYMKLRKMVGGGEGQQIIKELRLLLQIYRNDGKYILKKYMEEHAITLHDDSTNPFGIEQNMENISTLLELFDKKFENNEEQGYYLFDDFAIGFYACVDAKVEVLSKFLTIETIWDSSMKYDTIIGNLLHEKIKNLCEMVETKTYNKDLYDKELNINEVFYALITDPKIKLGLRLNKISYIMVRDIFNKYIELFVDEIYKNILSCDGKYIKIVEQQRKEKK